MKRMWIWILIAVAGVGLLLVGCQATRAGYETAPYKVVRSDGKYELRDYPTLMLVEAPMAKPEASNDGFMRLFRFITGANEAKQKIAMTTPVFMTGSTTNVKMAFVLPANLQPASIPKPIDRTLKVRQLPASRLAVKRFSGGRNPKNEAESLALLQSWMQQEHLLSVSGPIYGYFDPPWTPVFLRRNEVMLRIADSTPQ